MVAPEDKRAMEERLAKYAQRVGELEAQRQAKPDMVACREMRGTLPKESYAHGHPLGVAIGQQVQGKGALSVLGIHCNITAGIFYKGPDAYAITLSAGYIDDKDNGLTFEYTGCGGQDPKTRRQISDQQWRGPNAALMSAFEQRKPIRVCRKVSNGPKDVRYAYEGLYRIIKLSREKGTDGFMICKFTFEGLHGHSTASIKVEMKRLFELRRRQRQLVKVVDGPSWPRVQPKPAAAEAPKSVGKKRRRVIMEDVAHGTEARAIPVCNEIDDAVLPPFQYTSRNIFISEASKARQRIGEEDPGSFHPAGACGLKRMRINPQGEDAQLYIRVPWKNDLGKSEDSYQLKTTHCALFECDASCRHPSCRHNRVVQRGITLPIEVFYTGPDRGWGVRCRRDIDPGEFICAYHGDVVTSTEAEDQRQGVDEYLFDLNHFCGLDDDAADLMAQAAVAAEIDTGFKPALEAICNEHGISPVELELRPRPPAVCKMHEEDGSSWWEHLVIDAKARGGVGRFLNHSCDPNVLVQSVLTPGQSSLHYTVAFFCGDRKIPAGTELCYDYGYKAETLTNRMMICRCGAATCRKRLL